MKKWIIRISIAVVVLAIVGLFLVGFFLGGIVKSGVEVVGPKITRTEVALSGVSLSLLGGSATINGLVVGNPPGYKAKTALEASEKNNGAKFKVTGKMMEGKLAVASIEEIK